MLLLVLPPEIRPKQVGALRANGLSGVGKGDDTPRLVPLVMFHFSFRSCYVLLYGPFKGTFSNVTVSFENKIVHLGTS